jgi:F-type H+-transporting ATPase subunit gamma
MPSLKAIRKRISSVQSTQKITRALKMVAGARLPKAQARINELRPYAVKTQELLSELVVEPKKAIEGEEHYGEPHQGLYGEHGGAWDEKPAHPLLVDRPEKRVLLVVLTSDRGLCGAFNTNINKRAEREWKDRSANGQDAKMFLIGRKGRDYMTRRNAPVLEFLPGVWDKLSIETAEQIGEAVLAPFNRKEIDAIYLVYNEFKSAMSQRVVVERLLPVQPKVRDAEEDAHGRGQAEGAPRMEHIFEPDRGALLDRLVPMYVDVSILRALYESQASELGARMTAMDAATKNAKEMIGALTLQYNKARQAAITKELMEIIGGSEALKE